MREFCPLCAKNGVQNKVLLYQINLQEATWACESAKCVWPFGHKKIKFVPRKVGEVLSSKWGVQSPSAAEITKANPISNELSLYTPPVTPSADAVPKESVAAENTTFTTNPTLLSGNTNPPNVLSRSRDCKNRLRNSYASECNTIERVPSNSTERLGVDDAHPMQDCKSNKKDISEIRNGYKRFRKATDVLGNSRSIFSCSDDETTECNEKSDVPLKRDNTLKDISMSGEAVIRNPAKKKSLNAAIDVRLGPICNKTVKNRKQSSLTVDKKQSVRNNIASAESTDCSRNPATHVESTANEKFCSGNDVRDIPKVRSIEKANFNLKRTAVKSSKKNRFVNKLANNAQVAIPTVSVSESVQNLDEINILSTSVSESVQKKEEMIPTTADSESIDNLNLATSSPVVTDSIVNSDQTICTPLVSESAKNLDRINISSTPVSESVQNKEEMIPSTADSESIGNLNLATSSPLVADSIVNSDRTISTPLVSESVRNNDGMIPTTTDSESIGNSNLATSSPLVTDSIVNSDQTICTPLVSESAKNLDRINISSTPVSESVQNKEEMIPSTADSESIGNSNLATSSPLVTDSIVNSEQTISTPLVSESVQNSGPTIPTKLVSDLVRNSDKKKPSSTVSKPASNSIHKIIPSTSVSKLVSRTDEINPSTSNCDTQTYKNGTLLKQANPSSPVKHTETLKIDGLPAVILSYELPTLSDGLATGVVDTGITNNGIKRNLKQENLGKIVSLSQDNNTMRKGSNGQDTSVSIFVDLTSDTEENVTQAQDVRPSLELSSKTSNTNTTGPMRTIKKRSKRRGQMYEPFSFSEIRKLSKTAYNKMNDNDDSKKNVVTIAPSSGNVSTCSQVKNVSEVPCATITSESTKNSSCSSNVSNVSNAVSATPDSKSTKESNFNLDVHNNSNAGSVVSDINKTLESNSDLQTMLNDLLVRETQNISQEFDDDWLTSLLD